MSVSVVRDAVATRIAAWWASDAIGACVVSGTFGTGKSHVLARLLAGDTDWFGFLREPDRPVVIGTSRSRDEAQLGATTIAGWIDDIDRQLREAFPSVAAALASDLAAAATGRGVEIHDVGSIGELHFESRDDERWDRTVKPLLARIAGDRPVLIVVDALDELSAPLVRFLSSRLDELPPGVRAIVSTRPEIPLTGRLHTVVSLDGSDLGTGDDLTTYCRRRLAGLDLGGTAGGTLDDAIEAIVDRSGNLFLYCAFVCDDLRQVAMTSGADGGSVDRFMHSLPRGIDELYARFTDRIRAQVTDWSAAREVLGSVAVSFGTGLSPTQLSLIHRDHPRRLIQQVLDAARHYLSEHHDADGGVTYVTSHLSLAQYWSRTPEPGATPVTVHPADAHQRIALGLLDRPDPFADRYTTEHVVAHLAEAIDRFGDHHTVLDRDPVPLVTTVTSWAWIEHRLAAAGTATAAILDLIRADAAVGNLDDGPALLDRRGECGFSLRSLLRALRYMGWQLASTSDDPQRVAQQLQFMAVYTADAEADGACQARLDHLALPCATMAWSTHRISPHFHTTLAAGTTGLTAVAWSPDGTLVASGDTHGTARVWDPDTGEVLGEHACRAERPVEELEWSTDGSLLAVRLETSVEVIDLDDGAARPIDGHRSDYRYLRLDDEGHVVEVDEDTALLGALRDHASSPELERRSSWITDAAWSPVAPLLATAGQDWTVRVTDPRTASTTAVLRGHTDWVLSCAWSVDGTSIATVSRDGTARIWDVATSAQLLSVEVPSTGHDYGDAELVWTTDFDRIVGFGNGVGYGVWHPLLDPLTIPGIVAHFYRDGRGAAVSPDGERLAVVADNGNVGVYRTDDGALVWTVDATRGRSPLVMWSPCGSRLGVSGGGDEDAAVYDAADGAVVAGLRAHTGAIVDLEFSPDGRRIATASDDGTAVIWNVEAERAVDARSEADHSDTIDAMSWAPSTRRLATGGADGRVVEWDVDSGTPLAWARAVGALTNGIEWSPAGDRAAIAWGPGSWIWDPPELPTELPGAGRSGIRCIGWSPSGDYVAAAERIGSVRIVKVDDPASPKTFPVWDDLCVMAWSPTDDLLAASYRNSVEIIAPGAERAVTVGPATNGDMASHRSNVFGVCWSPDGQRIVTIDRAGTCCCWDPANGVEQWRTAAMEGEFVEVVWSHDGSRLVTAGPTGGAIVLGAADGTTVASIADEGSRVWHLDWSPEDRVITTVTREPHLRLWDSTSGAALVDAFLPSQSFASDWIAPRSLVAAFRSKLCRLDVRHVPEVSRG